MLRKGKISFLLNLYRIFLEYLLHPDFKIFRGGGGMPPDHPNYCELTIAPFKKNAGSGPGLAAL